MTPEIILDSHSFNTDTSLRAQWGGVRRLYRHESNQGSVVEIDYWGTPMKLFVADAKYRALTLAYDTAPKSHGNPQLVDAPTDFLNGTADADNVALTYTANDAWIQSTYAALRNDGTAKSNTDFLMQVGTTQAAHHCRNQDIPGVGQLDLPNLYELIILYLESDNIDALDPTASDNRDKALGTMNTYGRFDFNDANAVWASTEHSASKAWFVRCEGNTNNYAQSNFRYGVAPVKELDV